MDLNCKGPNEISASHVRALMCKVWRAPELKEEFRVGDLEDALGLDSFQTFINTNGMPVCVDR
jgi:hypothetical protein